ncbi:hypothetical protein FD755_004282 [Muntiacus reevesi]|uniref:Uncharacterized protein n=1 Tax=Muntiacus reevesi TaxID=9886 RepID=A0A5J5MQG3_MUNRE|nr:hypothetical protein FD755_004282 [Muntiacus reevesi]
MGEGEKKGGEKALKIRLLSAASESLLPLTWLVSRGEKEFQAKEAGLLEKDTQENLTILQTYFQQDRDEVLDNLLAFVCAIWQKSMKTIA